MSCLTGCVVFVISSCHDEDTGGLWCWFCHKTFFKIHNICHVMIMKVTC